MFLLVTFGQKNEFVCQQWFSDESMNVTDKLYCNKSEVRWQKFPPYKICWPIWGFLSWSQMTKNAEKLRVPSLSGWHHSGAVCSSLCGRFKGSNDFKTNYFEALGTCKEFVMSISTKWDIGGYFLSWESARLLGAFKPSSRAREWHGWYHQD